jgi:hypothetical protein
MAVSHDELRPQGPSPLSGAAPRAGCTLRVEAVFKDVDETQVQMVAAEMIGRAHQLANQPECECDVDVSVQSTPTRAQSGPTALPDPRGGADAIGRGDG